MADVVDKLLGVSSAVSGVLSFIFYRLYKSRGETAKQVRHIPVWHPDLEFHDHLSSQDNHTLSYAAVEGVVKEMGRTLHSHHGKEEGVIMRSQIVEHKSKRVNGFWSDMKKTIKDSTEMVPFALVKTGGGDPKFRIEVTDPAMASHLQSELDVTYDRFIPHKASIMQIGLDRLFGEVTKGIQETEQMLLTGTSVLGVGKVFIEKGQIKLAPPDETSRTYILTKMRLSELVRHFESQSATFKIMAIVTAIIGGSLVTFLIYRHTKTWLEKRRQRLEFEEIRRSLAEQRSRTRRSSENEPEDDEEGHGRRERRDDDECVVCLGASRQVISLPCGHLAMCTDCAEALPLPKRCPVCRADVDRFIPVYRP